MILDPNMTDVRESREFERADLVVPARQTQPAREEGAEMDGPRVLVVEDEDDLRALLCRVLIKRMKATVSAAVDGLDAVRRLRNEEFELIISDVRMPRLNGLAFWNWTRANRPDQAKRFLFITGDPGNDENRQALTASRRAVLNKPFSLAEFELNCKRVLGVDAAQSQAA